MSLGVVVQLEAASASDLDVVNAARVSLAGRSDWDRLYRDVQGDAEDGSHRLITEVKRQLKPSDAKLINYLMSNGHGSPFEHGYFRFRVEAPMFVRTEHQRHRAGHSYNEISGRYVNLAERSYTPLPTEIRTDIGRPGHYARGVMADVKRAEEASELIIESQRRAFGDYRRLQALGVSREMARAVLPVGTITEYIWSCNPRSLMHFVGLRASETAQKEIRLVAEAALDALTAAMPVTAEAFKTHGRRAP